VEKRYTLHYNGRMYLYIYGKESHRGVKPSHYKRHRSIVGLGDRQKVIECIRVLEIGRTGETIDGCILKMGCGATED